MTYYTLDELIKMMEPQAQKDKALIRQCIEGLALYAAQHAQADPDSPKIQQLREYSETLAYYWGIVEDTVSLNTAILQPFDLAVTNAVSGTGIKEVTDSQRANTVYGLYRYGLDMVTSMGYDGKDYILEACDLIKEIAAAWDFETDSLDNLIDSLTNQAHTLEKEPEIETGNFMA